MRNYSVLDCPLLQQQNLFSKRRWLHAFIAALCCVVFLGGGGDAWAKKNQTNKPPSLANVHRAIDEHFSRKSDFQPQDVICKSDAAAIIGKLKKMGWRVSDQKAILSELLPCDHFLVAQFQDAQGRKFMRKIASGGQSYSRLDRLSQMNGGQQSLKHLFKTPKSEKYLQNFSAAGLRNLAKTMPRGAGGSAPRWKEIDKPTKKIYTASELKARLEKSHAAAKKKATSSK